MTDYFSKGDETITKLLKTALKESCGDDFARGNLLKRTWLTNREICLSETAYRLIPGLDMKKSCIATRFVTSGFPENRTNVYHKIDDEDINESNPRQGFKIENLKGRFKPTSTTIHQKYAMRPNSLDNMFLAQFAIHFETCQPPKNQTLNEGVSILMNNNLPKYILLLDGTWMKSKVTPFILRIHNSKRKEPKESIYAELLLFFPWRNEELDLFLKNPEEMINLFELKKTEVQHNRRTIYPYSTTVDEIMKLVEDENFKRNSSLYDVIDPEGQKENMEDEEDMEPVDLFELPDEMEPPPKMKNNASSKEMIVKPIILEDVATMKAMARDLSYEQRIVFDKMIHYVKSIAIERNGGLISYDPPALIATGTS